MPGSSVAPGLLSQFDQLLIKARVDRWVVVTGGPGKGKTAVLAAWLARREAAGDKVPHHFICRGWANWDDPATLVGSLVAQIAARFPVQREPDANARMAPAARLAATIIRVSERELVRAQPPGAAPMRGDCCERESPLTDDCLIAPPANLLIRLEFSSRIVCL